MGFIEIILIGVGLSMDAVAVAMTNGMVYKHTPKQKVIAMPILFGLFQGLMPLIGYFAGGLFEEVLCKYAGFLVFLILGFIGGKMLRDAFGGDEEVEDAESQGEGRAEKVLTYKVLVIQAIATSIDAFAVGIALSAMQVSIVPAVISITVITALCCSLAIFIGKKCGDILGNKAEIIGGVILLFIAIKALL